jgi:putative transposase
VEGCGNPQTDSHNLPHVLKFARVSIPIDYAYAERFVRSIKDECLNRMIFFNEWSLRKATREFATHYHRERNHQGIDNRLIEPGDRLESTSSAIECIQRLGGMLRFYHRAAA